MAKQQFDRKSADFYSARLLYIILVDTGVEKKRNYYDESVRVFRARNSEEAFSRALTLGQEAETDYLNDQGQRVRWALVKILNIDWIGKIIDGKEVASCLHYRTTQKAISPKAKFRPEKSKPTESL